MHKKIFILLGAGLIVSLGVAEVYLRHAPPPAPIREKVRALAAKIADESGLDPAWFESDPTPAAPARSVEGENSLWKFRHAQRTLEATYVWNKVFLQSRDFCDIWGGWFRRSHQLMTFRPTDGKPYPMYRFYPSAKGPIGFATNAFGWRGNDLATAKPPRTVRIAFVGAGNTVGGRRRPFTYPQYVENWLNLWAQASNRRIKFEAINGARYAARSRDTAAIVREEILPVAPDLVVYYEGSQQFWPGARVLEDFDYSRKFLPSEIENQERPLETHSALARRVYRTLDRWRFHNGAEPEKPRQRIRWRNGLDEHDPDLTRKDLPLKLSKILADLSEIDRAMARIGGKLVVSSYIWLADEGLRLELPKHYGIYRTLNGTFWPMRYAVVRRYADFQNRVLEKFARERKIAFIDVAAKIPRDPDLFGDAATFTRSGERLHAWAVFSALLPLVKAGLDEGRLPTAPKGLPPSIRSYPIEIVDLEPIKTACRARN